MKGLLFLLLVASALVVGLPQDARKPVKVTRAAPTATGAGGALEDMRVAEIRTFTDPRPPVGFDLEAFCQVADRMLSERFEVPSVQWLVLERMPTVPVLSCESVGLYDRGKDLITIYRRTPDGGPIPDEFLRYQFFHGWVHHLEKWRAVPRAAPGHESEFDRFLQIMGLIRPRR